MPNAVSTYLTYANLQMASEATKLDQVQAGTLALKDALESGNNRSNKFTPTQAAQFVQEWRVLDHRANTGTGFSGTLFEYIGTNTDPSLGPVSGQRVVSLRSTEFVDDAVRDSQATNDLEIFDGGWVDLKLTRFRGHLILMEEGVRHAHPEAPVSGGIPSTDGRAGPGRPHAGAACA